MVPAGVYKCLSRWCKYCRLWSVHYRISLWWYRVKGRIRQQEPQADMLHHGGRINCSTLFQKPLLFLNTIHIFFCAKQCLYMMQLPQILQKCVRSNYMLKCPREREADSWIEWIYTLEDLRARVSRNEKWGQRLLTPSCSPSPIEFCPSVSETQKLSPANILYNYWREGICS